MPGASFGAKCWSACSTGSAFAVIMGAVAAVWFNVTDLGLVIGLAMVTVLAAAALGGILIPLLLTAWAPIRRSRRGRSSPR